DSEHIGHQFRVKRRRDFITAVLIGGRVFAAMKRSLGFSERVRQATGAAVLAGVAAIALGLDTGILSQISYASTTSFEQHVLDRLDAARGPEQ
ncbi:hypothetical protein EN814_34165, partial [Mesorhizobium sp. M2D.F.Ca.ET.171.01.1.1]